MSAPSAYGVYRSVCASLNWLTRPRDARRCSNSSGSTAIGWCVRSRDDDRPPRDLGPSGTVQERSSERSAAGSRGSTSECHPIDLRCYRVYGPGLVVWPGRLTIDVDRIGYVPWPRIRERPQTIEHIARSLDLAHPMLWPFGHVLVLVDRAGDRHSVGDPHGMLWDWECVVDAGAAARPRPCQSETIPARASRRSPKPATPPSR